MKNTLNLKLSPPHPLGGVSFINWLRLLWKIRAVDKKYLLRVLHISLTSFFSIPFRICGQIEWNRKIKNIRIQHPPVFIIGFQRSGTTYLHYLLSQDENLGYVSNLLAFMPGFCTGSYKYFRVLIGRQKRPMDDVLITPDSPQEEGFAVLNLLPSCSLYLHLFFPVTLSRHVQRAKLSEREVEQLNNAWKETYMKVLQKTTYMVKGRRLVLKNPFNIIKIPILLELFPEAKFIHIYRNPYIVYASAKHAQENLLQKYTLQNMDTGELEEMIFSAYQAMIQRFWETKGLIPDGNLVEVKFETLESDPLQTLERIYKELSLPGFENSKEKFDSYIYSQKDYKKNRHRLDDETIAEISLRWKFALERLHYTVPEELIVSDS